METDQSQSRLNGVAVFFYVFLPFALGHYLSSLLRWHRIWSARSR